MNDDVAVVRRARTIENSEEEKAERKALAPRKHKASSGIKRDDATYITLTDVTASARTSSRSRGWTTLRMVALRPSPYLNAPSFDSDAWCV